MKYTNCDINILKIAAFFREEVKKLYCPYMGIQDHVFITRSRESRVVYLGMVENAGMGTGYWVPGRGYGYRVAGTG